MINFAHLHLVINHIPLIGIPIALLFLAYSLWTKNTSTQKFSLFILMGLALVILPVYLTGEPAEEVVEHLPGVAESFIESHEDAAKFSMILTLITGAAAAFSFLFQKFESQRPKISLAILGLGILATLSVAYTANLGGKIRHTEFRTSGEIEKNNSTE